MTDELAVLALSAIVVGIPAVRVVRTGNLVRAVFWLALTLLGTAVLYALLQASFLAGVQVLTYVGGVVTLMVFGVMVTRRHETAIVSIDGRNRLRSAVAAGGFFAALAWAIVRTDLSAYTPASTPSTQELAHDLLDTYLLAFEVTSVLLLAAIICAVVLARRRDPELHPGRAPAAPEEVSPR
jgi:NADH-quinone oxidoreductase subunit J